MLVCLYAAPGSLQVAFSDETKKAFILMKAFKRNRDLIDKLLSQ